LLLIEQIYKLERHSNHTVNMVWNHLTNISKVGFQWLILNLRMAEHMAED